ncbi:MAG: IS200/IS605 family transposase [Candidatus Altiarchaeales archaeon]|nr:IS200/IS605 family transposase [Candidatus Altiarchaeales archaeon]
MIRGVKYKRLSHAVYCCDYHIVLVSKYRHKIFNKGVFSYVELRLKEIRRHYPQIEYKAINHDRDHIHMLISIPPKMSVGQVVRIIKSNTSRGIKEKLLFLRELYWGTDGIWSDGYFVSTVGINESVIKQYVEKQGEEDSGQAMLDIG